YSRDFIEKNMGYPIIFNADKSKQELGVTYRNIETSLVEHFQQLLDDGVVKKYI
ncbi:MAG: diaminohydroxyphosphoribosylaminopyrimidine deaminase, partial [Acinetobacter sp.]